MRNYKITGMSCAACSARVERAVRAVAGISECSVNLLAGSMSVVGDASDEAIIAAVTAAGYGIKPISKSGILSVGDPSDEAKNEKRNLICNFSGGVICNQLAVLKNTS